MTQGFRKTVRYISWFSLNSQWWHSLAWNTCLQQCISDLKGEIEVRVFLFRSVWAQSEWPAPLPPGPHRTSVRELTLWREIPGRFRKSIPPGCIMSSRPYSCIISSIPCTTLRENRVIVISFPLQRRKKALGGIMMTHDCEGLKPWSSGPSLGILWIEIPTYAYSRMPVAAWVYTWLKEISTSLPRVQVFPVVLCLVSLHHFSPGLPPAPMPALPSAPPPQEKFAVFCFCNVQ